MLDAGSSQFFQHPASNLQYLIQSLFPGRYLTEKVVSASLLCKRPA